LGYSKSVEKGIFKAENLEYTHVITIDADGELSPMYIKKYLKIFKKEGMIFGIRKKKPRFAEYLIGQYFKKKFGVDDITCGMKGLDLSFIRNKKFKIVDNNLGLSIFNYLLINKMHFSQCFVSGKKRKDKSRYGNAIKSNLKIIFTMIKLSFDNFLKEKYSKNIHFLNFSI